MNPFCHIFLTDDEETFLLQSYAPKGNRVVVVSLTAIERQKMMQSAGHLLTPELRGFSSRVERTDYGLCNFYPYYQCRYPMVAITLHDECELKVGVWHIDQIELWRGDHDEVLPVSLEASDLEIYNTIMTAFSRCRDFLWLSIFNKPLPYVEVYQSDRRDAFSIIRWMDVALKVRGRGITLWGYPLTMSRQDFINRGRQIIESDQREYASRTFVDNPNRRPSPSILKSDGYLDQKKATVQFDAAKNVFFVETCVFSEQSQEHQSDGPVVEISANCTDAEFNEMIFAALSRSRHVDD